MLAAGIKTPVPLEELESHLRDEIARQMQSGLDAPQALAAAVQKIGVPNLLKSEFRKNEGNSMKRTIVILAALFGTMFGGAMIMPALALWSRKGILHPGPLLTGSLLVIIGGLVMIHGVKTLRGSGGRKLITGFTIAAGTFYVVPLIQSFFVPNVDLTDWLFCILLAAASILFYGSCLYIMWRFPAPPTCAS